MQKGVIDFRLRPTTIKAVRPEFVREILRKMNIRSTESFEQQSVPLLIGEMDAAGIEIGVIGSRTGTVKPGFDSTTNEDVARLVAAYPGRFVGFGVVDSSDPATALEDIDRAAALGLVGITIEPSQSRVRMTLDDRRIYQIYEKAQERGLALFTAMSCLVGPYMEDTRPELIDHVATDFPSLNIVIQHAGWPYVREAIGVAYKQPNVFLVPGQYLHYGFPGAQDLLTAANGILADQMLYGSVYPICGSFVELMRIVDALGLTDSAKHKYLQGNARRLLKLP